MNAAARALAEGSLVKADGGLWTLSSRTLGFILLLIVVLASALTVVYIKSLNRQLFIELQALQQTRDQLHVEWGQLLLEQNTWAAPARIQAVAQQQFNMVIPAAKDIAVITLASNQ